MCYIYVFIHLIYIESNKLGDKGAKYLSESDWCDLNTLYIGKNNISGEGIKCIRLKWKNISLVY